MDRNGADRSAPENKALAQELLAIAGETDGILSCEGFLGLGARLKGSGRLREAAAIFSALLQDSLPFEVRDRAASELDSLQGRGSSGMRTEFLLSRLARDASDYRAILPMVLGTAVSSLVRGVSLSRIQGWAARLSAGGLAFAAEVPAFALSARFLAAGRDSGEAGRVGLVAELGSAALSLGLLRVLGQAGIKGAGLLEGIGHPGIPARSRRSLAGLLLPQALMVGGLLIARRLEEGLRWRPRTDDATSLVDAVSTMLCLHVGSSLGRVALGGGLAKLQLEAEYRSRQAPLSLPRLFPEKALVSGLSLMSQEGGEGGVRSGEPPPSSRSFGMKELAALKGRLASSRQEAPERMPDLVVALMKIAFSDRASPEVRKEAGRTLFNDGYFRHWQERLIAEVRPQVERLSGLSEESLADLAGKCMAALELRLAKGEDRQAAELLGPIVYMAFRSQNSAIQNRIAELLIGASNPIVRLGALIHEFPGLNNSVLRVLQWDQYERVLTFNDLLSENPGRRTLGKALLAKFAAAEKESGSRYRPIESVVAALKNPALLSEIHLVMVPETAITKEGIEYQVERLFAPSLAGLRPKLRRRILAEIADEAMRKAEDTSCSRLREIFQDEGLGTFPRGAPMKFFPGIASSKLRELVAKKAVGQEEASALASAFGRLFGELDRNMAAERETLPGYLKFVHPFLN